VRFRVRYVLQHGGVNGPSTRLTSPARRYRSGRPQRRSPRRDGRPPTTGHAAAPTLAYDCRARTVFDRTRLTLLLYRVANEQLHAVALRTVTVAAEHGFAAQRQLAEQIAQERARRNADAALQRAELADDLKLLTGR
jgi:hypothetical protein